MTGLLLDRTLSSRDELIRRALVGGAGAAASVALALALTRPGGLALAIPLAAVVLAVGLGVVAPRALLMTLVVWLVLLGLARRMLGDTTDTTLGDTLLLIGPAAIGTLVVTAALQGAFRSRTRLANLVLVLSGLIAVSALNPLQGGPATGAAGLLFLLVPLLAFWIGRAFCDDATYSRIVWILGASALLVAVYGLYQTFVGYPSWDQTWVEETQDVFLALLVDGVALRPFASFASPAEYSYFVAAGIVVWIVLGARALALPFGVGAIALLGIALVYISSRTAVVLLAFALAVVFAAWRRMPIVVAVATSLVALTLLPFVAGLLLPANPSQDRTQLVYHQVGGLANPLDPQHSTLLGHLDLVWIGLENGVREPLGRGAGSVTLAADRFGGEGGSTEADPSNLATALGIAGLALYLALLVLVAFTAYRVAVRRGDRLALVALGIVAVTLFQWFNGGHYAMAFLTWLTIGWLDRQSQHQVLPSAGPSTS